MLGINSIKTGRKFLALRRIILILQLSRRASGADAFYDGNLTLAPIPSARTYTGWIARAVDGGAGIRMSNFAR